MRDHSRLCEGREYTCTCGYDKERDDEIEHLKSLNKDAHAIIDKIWAIFGTPTYEELAGRTIYDMVQACVDRERETAAVNEKAVGIIYDRNAHIEELERALHQIIELDHHNMGPESRATKIARAALNGDAA